jgi:hypothetical protein
VFRTEADFELVNLTINGTFGVQLGRGGSGACLKELTKKLATLNSPSTVSKETKQGAVLSPTFCLSHMYYGII